MSNSIKCPNPKCYFGTISTTRGCFEKLEDCPTCKGLGTIHQPDLEKPKNVSVCQSPIWPAADEANLSGVAAKSEEKEIGLLNLEINLLRQKERRYQSREAALKRGVVTLWQSVENGTHNPRSLVGDVTLNMKEILFGDGWPKDLIAEQLAQERETSKKLYEALKGQVEFSLAAGFPCDRAEEAFACYESIHPEINQK